MKYNSFKDEVLVASTIRRFLIDVQTDMFENYFNPMPLKLKLWVALYIQKGKIFHSFLDVYSVNLYLNMHNRWNYTEDMKNFSLTRKLKVRFLYKNELYYEK